MIEANLFFLELFIVMILIIIGYIRGQGLWFFFAMIMGMFVIMDLFNNGSTIVYISGAIETPVVLPNAVYMLVAILEVVAAASVIHMYRTLRRGPV